MKLRHAAAPLAAAALALGVLAPTASAQSEDIDTSSLENLGDIDTSSLENLGEADENEECVLPSTGGSVDEMSGSISAATGVPSSAVSSVSGSLGSVDNPLTLLGFDEYLAEAGSLEGALCGVLGGEMEDPTEPSEAEGSLGDLGSGSGEGSQSGS